CCHYGKTPPCTEALVAAGVGRVVAAMVDPFAKVRGRGAAYLRRHGIAVDFGLLETEARELNAPFSTRIGQRRPYVIAKWAQTLDGCVATATGESKWISSEESRAWVQTLRGRVDGILVGLGTVRADDPLLMARPERGRDIKRIATRIVLDSECRLSRDCQLVRTVSLAPVLVVHGARLDAAAERRRATLERCGVMTVGIPVVAPGGSPGLEGSRDRTAGRPSVAALLHYLAGLEYTNLLVEGGPEVHAAFLCGGLMDEAHVFVAPKIIGGSRARHAIGGADLAQLAEAVELEFRAVERSGPDLHLVALPLRQKVRGKKR
ncbi:MAG: bifunctional diaminohydroxyphosphoribosylaminopyrimidine deaminase/5-amino-6-(5-phosphoribosylamino)uracil reductase RibD, partial [Phycisphaerae bacterium]